MKHVTIIKVNNIHVIQYIVVKTIKVSRICPPCGACDITGDTTCNTDNSNVYIRL